MTPATAAPADKSSNYQNPIQTPRSDAIDSRCIIGLQYLSGILTGLSGAGVIVASYVDNDDDKNEPAIITCLVLTLLSLAGCVTTTLYLKRGRVTVMPQNNAENP